MNRSLAILRSFLISWIEKWSSLVLLFLLIQRLIPGLTQAQALEGATALGKLAAQMKPGTWAVLETNGLSGDFLRTIPTGDSILSYADSASWDPNSRQLLFLGAPHLRADKFIIYQDATNTWTTGPLPPLDCITPEAWERGEGCTDHAYDHNTIDPRTGTFYYRFGLGAANSRRLFKYNIASNSWSELPSIPGSLPMPSIGGMAYFPEMGGIILVSGGKVFFFNTTTHEWSLLTSDLAMGRVHSFAEYNPIHKVVIFGGGNDSPDLYKINASGTITKLKNAPIELRVPGSQGTYITVDPVSGKYLVFQMPPGGRLEQIKSPTGGQFYEYDVTTDTWALQASTHPLVFQSFVTPISTYGIIMAVVSDRGNNKRTWVYLYKHSPNLSKVIPPAAISPSTPIPSLPKPQSDTTKSPSFLPKPQQDSSASGTMVSSISQAPTSSAVASPIPSGTLSISLIIQELLPADDTGARNIKGRARAQEPVTSGIPLKDSDNVRDISELAVFDTAAHQLVPAQFRALNRYPSGNIQWVLVDVQADVPANGTNSSLHLIRGQNPRGVDLAQDRGTTIAVNTGVAEFTIRKANQNVIDAAIIQGVQLLTADHQGGLLYEDDQGTLYTSRNDSTSTALIEENGPLRATVKETGRLRSSSGANSFGYTTRLIFYKDKPYVKAQVSIENAFRDSLTRKVIKSIALRLPLSLTTAPTFTFSTRDATLSGSLVSQETSYLYQANTKHKRDSRAVRVRKSTDSFFLEEWDAGVRLTEGQEGFTIRKGTTILYDFQGEEDYTRGFGDLQDTAGRGLTLAMRDFDSFFPASIEFSGKGEVSLEIFSKYNSQQGLLFAWGVHETREILLDFHATSSNPELSHYRIQYPLFARAPYEQYRITASFLGRTRLVSFDEMVDYHKGNTIKGVNQFAAANEGSYSVTQYTLPNQQIVRMRSYNWSAGGRQTNNDQTVPKLLSFLSTGHGGLYQAAYNFIHFITDQAIHRSDREDRTTWPKGLEFKATGPKDKDSFANGRGSSKFEEDMEHMNVLGVPLLYYLTGDESIREALIDHGEWLLQEHPARVTCYQGGRGWAQRAKWHSVLWEMLGDPQYKAQMDLLADNYLCSTIADPANPADTGQDMDRGYFLEAKASSPRIVNVGPKMQVQAESMIELMRVLPEKDPRKEELSDRLVGLAYFIAREAYFDRGGSLCKGFGGPPGGSKYNLDEPPLPDDAWRTIDLHDYTALLAHGYRMTKDPWFLYVGRRIVGTLAGRVKCQDGAGGSRVSTIRQGYASYSNWAAQDFIWTDLHQNEFGTVFLNEANGLQVTNNGGGSYTLRWTVPAGATKYQIKYGPQPMVQNLNFDKFARTYEFDPTIYNNFWAGNGDQVTNQPHNVTDEPTPAPPGTQQTYTISNLDPELPYHFAIKIFTSSIQSSSARKSTY